MGIDKMQLHEITSYIRDKFNVAFTYYTRDDVEDAFEINLTDNEWASAIDKIEECIGDLSVIQHIDFKED